MDTPLRNSNWLTRATIVLAVSVATLVLDGLLVAYVWASEVKFATMDRVLPGGNGFYVEPMPTIYKWLLGAVLAANVGILLYLLARKQHLHAMGMTVGAAVPMGCLIYILFTA